MKKIIFFFKKINSLYYKKHSGRIAKNDACSSYNWIEILKLEKGHTQYMGLPKIYLDWALWIQVSIGRILIAVTNSKRSQRPLNRSRYPIIVTKIYSGFQRTALSPCPWNSQLPIGWRNPLLWFKSADLAFIYKFVIFELL